MPKLFKILAVLSLLILGACAQPQPYDYTNFNQSNPKSIVVLPPTNHSPDVLAMDSVLAQVSYPLAENGYYVFPVAVVKETFIQNGLSEPDEIHKVSLAKLKEIFGADAVLYMDITDYGTTYVIVGSDTRVTASARLVDMNNGKLLWNGSATASSTESGGVGGHPLAILLHALVTQIIVTSTNQAHSFAATTMYRLVGADMMNGIPAGPRSPHYQAK